MLAAVVALLAASAVVALENGVGRTPLMGWGTWNWLGCGAPGNVWNESTIESVADALVSSGMRDAGYVFVNLDGGWQRGRDPATGAPRADPDRFPSGIPHLRAYLHARGLKLGMYRDRHAGFGFERQDAAQFAAWQVDYLKNDGYGRHDNVTSEAVYGTFRDAVNATGRPMVLNVKFDLEPHGFAAGAAVANSWRVGRDIRPVWADVVRLADIASAAAHWSGPGGFGDLDALEVGVPGQANCRDPASAALTMTDAEQRTHHALWCMAASPLVAALDVRNMSDASKAILLAPGPIAVNQDALGVAGRRVRVSPSGVSEAWARPLGDDGSFAVLLWHRGETCLPYDDSTVHTDPTPQIFWRSLGFSGAATVTDVWTGKVLGTNVHDHFPKSYEMPPAIPPHGHWFVKVAPSATARFVVSDPDDDDDDDSDGSGCPVWGCKAQRLVRDAWRVRVSAPDEGKKY